jgi:hypothetical protein
MRAAFLRPVALCALSVVLGAATARLLLPSRGAADTGTPQAPGVDRPARPEGFDAGDRDEVVAVSVPDALVRLAATEPRSAMDRALAIDSHWLGLDTAERVAAVWAEQSPDEALAFLTGSRELDPDAKSALRARMLETWARVDPGRLLGYLLTRDGQNLLLFDLGTGRFLHELSAQRPHELLSASNSLPKGFARTELRRFAVAGIVDRDLALALREALLAAPGLDRRQWVTAIYRAHPERADELGLCELDARIDPVCRD